MWLADQVFDIYSKVVAWFSCYAHFKRHIILHLINKLPLSENSWTTSNMLQGAYINLSISIQSFGFWFNHESWTYQSTITLQLFFFYYKPLIREDSIRIQQSSPLCSYVYFLTYFMLMFIFSLRPKWLKIRIFKEKVNHITRLHFSNHVFSLSGTICSVNNEQQPTWKKKFRLFLVC